MDSRLSLAITFLPFQCFDFHWISLEASHWTEMLFSAFHCWTTACWRWFHMVVCRCVSFDCCANDCRVLNVRNDHCYIQRKSALTPYFCHRQIKFDFNWITTFDYNFFLPCFFLNTDLIFFPFSWRTPYSMFRRGWRVFMSWKSFDSRNLVVDRFMRAKERELLPLTCNWKSRAVLCNVYSLLLIFFLRHQFSIVFSWSISKHGGKCGAKEIENNDARPHQFVRLLIYFILKVIE